ncbi:hypothetical protein AB0M34_01785 [Nocardia sp. NPDC050193]
MPRISAPARASTLPTWATRSPLGTVPTPRTVGTIESKTVTRDLGDNVVAAYFE